MGEARGRGSSRSWEFYVRSQGLVGTRHSCRESLYNVEGFCTVACPEEWSALKIRGFIAVVLALALVCSVWAMPRPRTSASTPGHGFADDRVLVKMAPSAAASLHRAKGVARPEVWSATSTLPIPSALRGTGKFLNHIAQSGWTVWQVPKGSDISRLVNLLNQDPRVVMAQPSYRIYTTSLPQPNDWDWNAWEDREEFILTGEGGFRRLWNLELIQAFEGWEIWPGTFYTAANRPTNTPVIAVIDTGSDLDHPDYRGANGAGTDITQGGQFIKSKSKLFQNGAISEIGDGARDAIGHGSHVAGIALAAGHNGGLVHPDSGLNHGIVGVGYPAQGMILRVFDDEGIGFDGDLAAALYYATDNGAHIVNMSLGTESYSQVIQDAITYAYQKGLVLVAAANQDGNGGGDLGPMYPAAGSGTIAVNATDMNGLHAANYAGTGNYLDVAAPGGEVVIDFINLNIVIQYIWSTSTRYPTGLSENPSLAPAYRTYYTYFTGNSMATPHVSGALALYMGKNNLHGQGGWANMRIAQALMRSLIPIYGGPKGGWEPTQGYGFLNIPALLLDLDVRDAEIGSIEGVVYVQGSPVENVIVTARNLATNQQYVTNTVNHGMYRYQNLPPGDYAVSVAIAQGSDVKRTYVVAGADTQGIDFWIGGTRMVFDENDVLVPWDNTDPVVPWLNITGANATTVGIDHWAYDPETTIDSMTFRIGTTDGGNDVMADRRALIGQRTFDLSGLNLQTGVTYHLTATYENGARSNSTAAATRPNYGLTVVKRTFSIGTQRAVSGTVNLDQFVGSLDGPTLTVELRNPGSTTPIETKQIQLGADGSFSFQTASTGATDIAIKGDRWLRDTVAAVNIAGTGVSGIEFVLFPGDINGDNTVDLDDYFDLADAFRTSPSDPAWNPSADLDGSDSIDLDDYFLLAENYRTSGDD